jgi:hypothetical protein
VAEEDSDPLLLIDELPHRQEGEPDHLAALGRGSDDDVVDVGLDLQKLLLEISRGVDLQFAEPLRDRGVVPEELGHRFLLLHGVVVDRFAIL